MCIKDASQNPYIEKDQWIWCKNIYVKTNIPYLFWPHDVSYEAAVSINFMLHQEYLYYRHKNIGNSINQYFRRYFSSLNAFYG